MKREKEYLKMKERAKRMQEKRRPAKGYTNDTLVKNLYKVFVALFPEGAPSTTVSSYAIQKSNSLPIYRI